MKIIKAKDYQDMSRKAANIISAQIIMKPDCVLGLATGSTPIGTYDQLIDWYKKGDLDFSQVSSVNLDEYRGLSHTDPQSYYYFMHDNLFNHVSGILVPLVAIGQNDTHSVCTVCSYSGDSRIKLILEPGVRVVYAAHYKLVSVAVKQLCAAHGKACGFFCTLVLIDNRL